MKSVNVYVKNGAGNEPNALIKSESAIYHQLFYVNRSIPAMPALHYVCLIQELPIGFKQITDPLEIKFWTQTVQEV